MDNPDQPTPLQASPWSSHHKVGMCPSRRLLHCVSPEQWWVWLAGSKGGVCDEVLVATAIVMLSGLSLEEDGLLGGLRQAWSSPKVGEVRTGLVLCPRNRSLVLNSSPGVLQFYDVTTQMVTEVGVVCGPSWR